MTDATQFTIGVDARCTDGICGEVSRVVVDPVTRAVTHLVVEPKHHKGLGRLVPLDLLKPTDGEIQICCTQVEFDKLDSAEETEFLAGNYGDLGYGSGQVLYHPYYGLGIGAIGMGMGGGGNLGAGILSQSITHDTVPLGEVAIRRGEHVHATDGNIGKVQGLVVDPRNHHVTHVLLQEGHLWGQKDVAIPISAVTNLDDGIQLNLAKEDVKDLPPVEIDYRK